MFSRRGAMRASPMRYTDSGGEPDDERQYQAREHETGGGEQEGHERLGQPDSVDVPRSGAELPDDGKPLRIGVRERPQDYRLRHGEHHRDGAAPQRQDDDDAERKGGMLADSVERLSKFTEHQAGYTTHGFYTAAMA